MSIRSIGWPRMFQTNATILKEDHNATSQNLKTLLLSEKGELFGDPFYGVNLKKFLMDQNDTVLKDLVIDDIYTQLAYFMPQLLVKREDIEITQSNTKLYCTLKATNRLDYTTNMYSIVIFTEGDNKND